MSSGAVEKAHGQAHGGLAHHHHDHDGHVHELVHRPAAPMLAPSLLRLGLGARMLIASGLVALVWLMIVGALS